MASASRRCGFHCRRRSANPLPVLAEHPLYGTGAKSTEEEREILFTEVVERIGHD